MSFKLARALAQGRKAGRSGDRAELLHNLLRKRAAADEAADAHEAMLRDEICWSLPIAPCASDGGDAMMAAPGQTDREADAE